MQKADTTLAVTVRGSVETSRGARGTHPHIFERHPPGDTVATNTTISVTCGEPKCACHAARKKKPNSFPALEGQVHLSGETEYVRAMDI